MRDNDVQGPESKAEFTRKFDTFYTKFGPVYDKLVNYFPIWRNWLNQTLPYIQGKRVLEISFGTGYLLTQYAHHFEVCGIDYNVKMASLAHKNLKKTGRTAHLQIANVETLPYAGNSFDSIINTMAFSGYPDAPRAISEMYRVLKVKGKLIMIDINYPSNKNWLGTALCRGWAAGGDILRDMAPVFNRQKFEYDDREIGGFGSVHLYIATKRN